MRVKRAGVVRGRVILQLLLSFLALSLGVRQAHAAPGNDNFAGAQALSGASGSVAGANEAATSETGEPLHSSGSNSRSVWYSWVAPAAGNVRFGIESSFSPVIGVYTGTSVATLTHVADSGRTVYFDAVSGQSYKIAVASASSTDAGGAFQLNWRTVPSSTDPVIETVSSDLATPASGHQYLVPVVIIRYLPKASSSQLDENVTGTSSTLADMLNKTDVMNSQVKFALEQGSRYHGYKDANAKPALGYKVVALITVYESLPKSNFEIPWNPGIYRPDYAQVLNRFNAQNFVENQGVKEFWIWGYHHGDIEPIESDMASPTTGDISNSERNADDLPIFNKTYVLYNYNYDRTAAEAVHDHGHQLEAELSYINQQQDGNTDLFWKKFVGQDSTGKSITGRCGWTHIPPNTTADYDYANTALVDSDIEDWTPERIGQTKPVNVDTWRGISRAWPYNDAWEINSKTEAQWHVYWRQNIPGNANGIRYGSNYVTNWWQFVGDWDKSIADKAGLYTSTPPVPPAPVLWQALDLTVGSDNLSRLLWARPDKGFAFWTLSPSSAVTSTPLFGPLSGWNASAIGIGADKKIRALINNTDGRAAAWTVQDATSGSITSTPAYGPFNGFTCREVSGAADNTTRLLWIRSDGAFAVWTVGADGNFTSTPLFGPIAGWSANAISVGGDNKTTILLNNADGRAAVWTVQNASNGAITSTPAYGPITGFNCRDIVTGSDNKTRMLWQRTDGAFAVWTATATSTANNFTSTPLYGPIAGWAGIKVGVGADLKTRILLTHTDGRAAVWTVQDAAGNIASTPAFGPIAVNGSSPVRSTAPAALRSPAPAGIG